MRTMTSFFLASCFLFACGGSDGDATTALPVAQPTESQPKDPQPGDPQPNDPQPSTCNALTNDAQAISTIDVVAVGPPLPTGGAIPSGTFHLAGVTLYAGKSGKATSIPITLQGTVKVNGNAVEQVLDGTRPDGTKVAERSSESFTTSGNEVTFTKTCDGNSSRTSTYTATSSELTLFLINDVGQTVAYKYR
jgi:hypothetical protein